MLVSIDQEECLGLIHTFLSSNLKKNSDERGLAFFFSFWGEGVN